MSRWVRFLDVSSAYPHKLTKTWEVHSSTSSDLLGVIAWRGGWRQYCFYPAKDTLYNAECMNDIAAFCKDNRKVRNEVR